MIYALPLLAAIGAQAINPKMNLTVYNQGFALVKDVRTLQLTKGLQEIAVTDVAQQIEANSVGIRSISKPGSFSVLEQNYRYDLVSRQAILNKAVGGRISFVRVLPDGKKERLEGTLISAPNAIVGNAEGSSYETYNGLVIRLDDGRIVLDPTGEIELTYLPEGLISRPTLVWSVDSDISGPNEVELSYLTQGMMWSADYVLSLDREGKVADLKGWVTLTNNAGATFKDADLKLLAGDVQRARNNIVPMTSDMAGATAERKMANMVQEQFAEYHLYSVGRPVTVRDKEMKQVSLLEATGVKVTKKLIVDASNAYVGYRASEGTIGSGPIKPLVKIEIQNTKENRMGMPLPMGKVKVFQRDSRDSLQMLGEDSIQHTPKDETLSLTVGRAFDIVAERKRIAFEYINFGDNRQPRGARETYEVELRNRKETPETVIVIERWYGEFVVTKFNIPFTKPDSNTLRFEVPLKANEVRKLIYTVETKW